MHPRLLCAPEFIASPIAHEKAFSWGNRKCAGTTKINLSIRFFQTAFLGKKNYIEIGMQRGDGKALHLFF